MSDDIVDVGNVPGFDDSIDFDIPGFESEPEPKQAAKTEEAEDESLEDPQPKADEKTEEVKAAPKEDEAEKIAKAVTKKAEAKEKAEAAAARKLAFKAGDAVAEIDEDATIEWKVDGKKVPIKARELLDNYAGKVAWEKRNQDNANEKKALALEKQTLEASRESQKKVVLDMYENMKQNKLFDAVQGLVELTGLKVNGRDFVKQLRDMVIENVKQMDGFTPEQRELFELKEEREYLTSKYAKLDQQRAQEEAQKAFHSHLTTVAEQNGIEFDALAQTMEFLKDHARKSGGDPSKITPEAAVEHRKNISSFEVAREAIAAVEPELIKDNWITDEKRWEELAKLARKAAEDGFSKEEFIELYRETRKKKDAIAVSKKLVASPVSPAAKAITRKPKATDDDALDFTKISSEDAKW